MLNMTLKMIKKLLIAKTVNSTGIDEIKLYCSGKSPLISIAIALWMGVNASVFLPCLFWRYILYISKQGMFNFLQLFFQEINNPTFIKILTGPSFDESRIFNLSTFDSDRVLEQHEPQMQDMSDSGTSSIIRP